MRALFLSAIIACLFFTFAPAHAQDKKADREREQIRRLQAQAQKLQQEKLALENDKRGLDEKLKKVESEVDGAKRAGAGARRRATELETELTALKQKLEAAEKERAALSAQLKTATGRGNELDTANAKLEADGKRCTAALAQQTKLTDTCATRNARLYEIGGEILERYENKGVFSSLLAAEPFTGLKRVELENLVEDYRDKLDAQKEKAGAPAGR